MGTYNKTVWQDGDIITADKMNNIENGIYSYNEDITNLDEQINGGTTPATVTLPEPYKSAAYSNAAGTMKYKYENDKLVLSKSNGSAGEINTNNAHLTVDASLAYPIVGEVRPKLSFSYSNSNAENVAFLIIRYYNTEMTYQSPASLYLPVGEGSTKVDLVTLAEENNIDVAARPNIIIGAIRLEGGETYSTAIAYIDGFEVAGSVTDGIADKVIKIDEAVEGQTSTISELSANVDSISETVSGLSNSVAAMGVDVSEAKSELGLDVTYSVPEGYHSASYTNVAETMQFEYKDDQLILKKTNGAGEVNTGTANLTIGDTLGYLLDPEEDDILVFEYECGDTSNADGIMIRLYNDAYSAYRGFDVGIPLGTGTKKAHLVALAQAANIDMSIYHNAIIRGILISSGDVVNGATVWIDGFGSFNEKLSDRVLALEESASSVDGLLGRVDVIENTVDAVMDELGLTETAILPDGYKSANYSNAAGTMKFKYENNQLVLSKSDGTTGQINTTNASLTIDNSLCYTIDPAIPTYLYLSYENTNEAESDIGLIFRYYDSSINSNVRNVRWLIPTGTGTTKIDLIDLAEKNGFSLEVYDRFMIRAIDIASGSNLTTAIAYIYGITTQLETLKETVERVDSEIGVNRVNISSLGDDLSLLTSADSSAVGKIPVIASVSEGKVSGWGFADKGSGDSSSNEYLIRQMIPSYFLSYPTTPSSFDDQSYLQECIAKVPEGKSFIFITDTHWESNTKNSFKLMQYVKEKLGIHKVLFGGDCIDRGADKYKGLNLIRAYMDCAVDAFGKDFIVTIGNHDLNTGNAIHDQLDLDVYRVPYDQIFKVYLSHLGTDLHANDLSATISEIAESDGDEAELIGWSKLHYYVDDDEDMTRYIVLYSSAYDDIIPRYTGFEMDGGGGPTTVMQYEWFANTLMSTPTGYDIIVMAHCADSESPSIVFPAQMKLRNYFDFFVRIASAFHKKCSGYKIDKSNFGDLPTNPFWTNETKIWDFTNAPNVGKILFIAGHLHRNVEYVSRITTDNTVYPTYARGGARNNGNPALVGVVEGVEVFDDSTVDFSIGEMLTIISQTDAYNRTQPVFGGYDAERAEMTAETITEQSFDVITLTDNAVVCTKFGAGWDRTIPVKWT